MKNYFAKNGFVYGVSSKYNFGVWSHYVKKFTDYAKALAWLKTEEYDFRERELCSKTRAAQLAGIKAVKNAG